MTEHKNVYVALAAAQASMGPVTKGSTNPHFKSKYADLADVMRVVIPALTDNGICLWQRTEISDLGSAMVTTLTHGDSETSIECSVPLIVSKQDMQGMKSATTYAKRIGVESLCGIAPEDDDGNAAAASVTMAPREKSWADTVIEHADVQNGTPAQKAEAIADAICAEFKRKKTQAQLDNEWDRRKAFIARFESDFPMMHAQICAAYETQQNAFGEGA